jgi:hypothetical protein
MNLKDVDPLMTDAQSSKIQPQPPEPQVRDLAAPALILSAGAAEISAEAEERDRADSDAPRNPSDSVASPPARNPVVRRRRVPARLRGAIAASELAPVIANPTALVGSSDQVEDGSRPDTRAELRDWIKDNATLLSNASLLISLAAVALSLLPDVGIFSPYIKALIFAAAFLLLTELHHQWPEDLQLHMIRKNALPENHSWRMTAFALVMQVATILFAAWAILTNPIILLPLTALAVFFAFYRWYFRRHSGFLARIFGIVALVAVLLISELLMVVVWAAVTGEKATIQLWAEEDVPAFQFRIGD